MADERYQIEGYSGDEIVDLFGEIVTLEGGQKFTKSLSAYLAEVAQTTQAAINNLNADVNGQLVNGLRIAVSQRHGLVNGISYTLQLDTTPTSGSNKLVTSQGIKSYVDSKDTAEKTRAESAESVLRSSIDTEVAERQAAINALDFLKDIAADNGLSFHIEQKNGKINSVECSITLDNTPTQDSKKGVTSGGVKSYVDGEVSDEATARQQADETLQSNIDTEAEHRRSGFDYVGDRLSAINEKIPDAASSENQLADKNWVDGHIAGINTLGMVKLYTSSGTNRSGLVIQSGGALCVNVVPEYGLSRSGDGKVIANIRRSATSADIAKVGTAQAESYAAITTENLIEAVEKALEVTGDISKITILIPTQASSTNKLTDKDYVDTEINGEKSARQQADAEMSSAIQTIDSGMKTNTSDINNIKGKIPNTASLTNQLADRDYVDSSIATASATFRGTYNLVTDLGLTPIATQEQIASALATKMSSLSITPANNDYAYVQIPISDGTPTKIADIDRYKYNGSVWGYEYGIDNSGLIMTADDAQALFDEVFE